MALQHRKKLLLHALFAAGCLGLCALVLFGVQVAQTPVGRFALGAVTLACACLCPRAVRLLCEACPSARRRRVVSVSAALFLAFSLTGNRLFVYPIAKHVSAQEAALFLAAVLWAVPVAVCALAFILYAAQKVCPQALPMHGSAAGNVAAAPDCRVLWGTAAGVFGLILLAFGAYWLVYNPAVSSWDTLWQFSQATGTVPLHPWHSVFHTLMIHHLLKIYFSASFVALVQCAMVAAAAAYTASVLVRMGLRPLWILLAAALWAFSPSNATMLLMLQKDVPYTAALLWAAALFCEYVVLYHKKSVRVPLVWYGQYFLALVLIWVLRTNGMITVAVLGAGLLLLCARKPLAWAAVCLAVLCGTLYMTVGYTHYGLSADYGTEKYKALVRELCAVEAAGATQDALIKTIADHQKTGGPYDPYLAGNTNLGAEMDVPSFLGLYLREGVRHPVLYARSILCRTDLAWGLVRGDGFSVRMRETQTMEDNGWWAGTFEQRKSYVPAWTGALTTFVDASEQGVADILFWRPSLFVLAGVFFAGALLLRRQGRAVWLCAPVAAQMLSLLLTTPWNLYRYFWPLGVCALLFCAAAFASLKKQA